MVLTTTAVLGDGIDEYQRAYKALTDEIDKLLDAYYKSLGVSEKSAPTYVGSLKMRFDLGAETRQKIDPALHKFLPYALVDSTDTGFDTLVGSIPIINDLLSDYRKANWKVYIGRRVGNYENIIPTALVFEPNTNWQISVSE